MDVIAAVRKSSLFRFMNEKNLTNIIEMSGSIAKFKSGKQLFFEGDKAKCFYIFLEGKIRISKTWKDGKKTVLTNILPGNSFAEIILFEKDNYPATALAIEDSVVFKVDKKSFKRLLLDNKIAEEFIINLVKKIRYLARKVELFNNAEIPERFYHFVETHYGKNEVIEFNEPKKEIAEAIGTIPETFSRMISKLKKKNIIISWDKNKLVLNKGFWKNY
jgi:CRP-like cAMP-binding protein